MTAETQETDQKQKPPHDLDMERAILGAILLDESTIIPVMELLTPEMLYDSRNQHVYSAMMELRNNDKPIHPALLYDHLRTTGRIDDAGGPLYIANLEQFVLATQGTEFLAQQVLEKYRARQLLAVAQFVSDDVMRGADTPDEILSRLSSRLETVQQYGTKNTAKNGKSFLQEQLPPVEWLVEGLIPPGITFLVADPKVGKSRLASKIMGCIAGGSELWGRAVSKGRVLYCDNDESEDEMQERLRELAMPNDAEWNFDIDFYLPRLNQGGLARVDRWMKEHPDARMVVMDTWAKVMPQARGRSNAYLEDNDALHALKEWTRKNPKMGVLLVHHTSKSGGKGDLILAGSGSQALAGSAACWMVMTRNGADQAIIKGIGRRVRGFELLLESRGLDWDCLGDPHEAAMGDNRKLILDVLKQCPMSPSEIAKHTGIKPGTVRQLLRRMVGAADAKIISRGNYALPGYFEPETKQDKSTDKEQWYDA